VRPLFGVVISKGQALVIRLESGLKLQTTDDYAFGKYDKVAVFYDHTRGRIVRVEPHSEHDEVFEFEDASDEAVLADEEEEDEPSELLDDLDSGALEPWFDEEWDPEEGVLRVEGESSTE